ncbi:FHA domain-containing protein [Leptospira borgpetersenii]|uniref:FHA domain-containing protein n=1 Tax=Leptospira borgpetersenii TaxID=174 RepID=UPI0007746248|nr:FHA domain-containing protein [Leptospira borgpetersenii]MBE8400713.1 FHA domain-containing protein [Leptospira borgpetersenii serovar Tarassovi]MBE8403838.1 FHA domain-containing protein [Leptospira borgpetersenii serovar Tarassovi]MBE8405263.1 FHA domain-containing protein [Leptospira borgpetersenii serovar Tarassovi]MBE8413258.1 FHA domain-containing protein [Leptospira borgpetersenii serovar Tarassovi]MBE8415502.1 FHA domain-containing protein [Leptospira borgpetersenii serovar Tarassov
MMGYAVLLTLILFSFPLFSQKSPFILEDADSSSFPSVQLFIRDKKQFPLERENFLIRESKGSETRTVVQQKVLRKEGSRSVHSVFLVQSGTSLEENNFNTRFLQKAVQSSGEEDHFSFIFFSDDLLVVEKDLDKRTALSKARVPGSLSNRSTGTNLDLVFQKVNSILTRDSYLSLFVSDNDYKLPPGLRQGLSTSGLPIHVIGKRNFSNLELVRIYGGEFYEVNSADFLSKFLTDLEYFHKYPAEVRYDSPFRNDFWKAEGDFIRGDWQSSQGGKFTYTYKPGIVKQLRFIFLSPGVFLPTIGFLLILTLIALLLLFRRERDVRESSAPLGEAEKRFHARGEEREVYQRMYGDQLSPYASSEGIYVSRSLPVNESEFETAEAYDLATLIQKEGKSPGKQVPIRKPEITLGNGGLSDVMISDPGVSKFHARIRKIKNRFVLYDLISDGGTYLNGKKILRPRVLYDFDEISLGKTVYVFRAR